MIKLKDLILEKKGLLSKDEKIVIESYLRSSYGKKAGDLSSHLVEVEFSEDYRSDNAKNSLIEFSVGTAGTNQTLTRYNGGYALVKDKPYDAKLKAVLAHAGSKTVKGHWVEETPLSTIKKLGR